MLTAMDTAVRVTPARRDARDSAFIDTFTLQSAERSA
jgi:hypothetical protein